MSINKSQFGASLIEVMVAVTILGFGLLGLAAVQTKTTTMNDSAYYRSIAADLGNDLADRIRAIRTPYMVNVDANPQPSKPPDFSKCTILYSAVTCAAQDASRTTNETLAASEMTEWAAMLQKQLPGGTYTLVQAASTSTDYFRYTLTITWLDDRGSSANSSYSMVIE